MRCPSARGGRCIVLVLLLLAVIMLEGIRGANLEVLDATAMPPEKIYSSSIHRGGHKGGEQGGHIAFNSNNNNNERRPQMDNHQFIVANRGGTSIGDGPRHREAAVVSRRAANAAIGVRITRPLNESLLLVGDVQLAFETHGFAPSVKTPIEVFLPQNGDTPALVASGNLMTISIRAPSTQLVTLAATVHGQRVSDSVVFSSIPNKNGVQSARVPLPPDAKWGGWPLGAPVSRPNDFDEVGNGLERSAEVCERHDLEEDSISSSELMNGGRVAAGAQSGRVYGVGAAAPPRPLLSLVFVGSLSFDGQKFVWMQQMEGLSRRQFAPTYLTFQDAGVGAQETEYPIGRDKEEDTQTRTTPQNFEQRLRLAGVPLVKILSPRLEASWDEFERLRQVVGKADGLLGTTERQDGNATDYIDRTVFEGPGISLREAVWKAVLDSIDRAGGDPGLMSPPWTRQIFDNIAQAVESISPDILVVANARTLGDAVLTRAARWAMGTRGHIVMDFPNLDPAPGIKAEILTAPSHYVARHPALEAVAASTGADVVVIPPGVSFDEPSRATAGADDSRTEGALCHPACNGNRETTDQCDPACRVLGFAGRLSPEKSPGLFLMVAKHLIEMAPSSYFVVVGDGVLRPALEVMANRLGIASRVHFTGWASGTELQRLLRGVDLLFNPSLSSETFSIVNIESMAVATPAAAFGIGGMLEYLVPGVNAVVLDDPEPHAAAREIAKVLLDPRRLAELGDKGRAEVRRNFRADTALRRWTELYEALGKS